MYSSNSNLSLPYQSTSYYDSQLSFENSLISYNQYDYNNSASGYTTNSSRNDTIYSKYGFSNNVYENENNISTSATCDISSHQINYYNNDYYNYLYYNYGYYNPNQYNSNQGSLSSHNHNYYNTSTDASTDSQDKNDLSSFYLDSSKIKTEPQILQSTPIYQDNSIQLKHQCDKKTKPRNILNQLDELSSNHHCIKRRAPFTTKQRYYLLQIFEKSLYPTRDVLEEAARNLNVSVKTLQTWFKNARSKQKKHNNI